MTTIATDGKCVAFDSLVTGGGTFVFGHIDDKCIEPSPGIIIGAAGRHDDCKAFQEWACKEMLSSQNEKPKLGDEFVGIIVDLNAGRCHYYTEKLKPLLVNMPFAIGAGDELAIGAMLAGAHPIDAVEIASHHRINTGGDVHCLPLAASKAYDRESLRAVLREDMATSAPADWRPEFHLPVYCQPDVAKGLWDFWQMSHELFLTIGGATNNNVMYGEDIEIGVLQCKNLIVRPAYYDHTKALHAMIGTLIQSRGDNGRPDKAEPISD